MKISFCEKLISFSRCLLKKITIQRLGQRKGGTKTGRKDVRTNSRLINTPTTMAESAAISRP